MANRVSGTPCDSRMRAPRTVCKVTTDMVSGDREASDWAVLLERVALSRLGVGRQRAALQGIADRKAERVVPREQQVGGRFVGDDVAALRGVGRHFLVALHGGFDGLLLELQLALVLRLLRGRVEKGVAHVGGRRRRGGRGGHGRRRQEVAGDMIVEKIRHGRGCGRALRRVGGRRGEPPIQRAGAGQAMHAETRNGGAAAAGASGERARRRASEREGERASEKASERASARAPHPPDPHHVRAAAGAGRRPRVVADGRAARRLRAQRAVAAARAARAAARARRRGARAPQPAAAAALRAAAAASAARAGALRRGAAAAAGAARGHGARQRARRARRAAGRARRAAARARARRGAPPRAAAARRRERRAGAGGRHRRRAAVRGVGRHAVPAVECWPRALGVGYTGAHVQNALVRRAHAQAGRAHHERAPRRAVAPSRGGAHGAPRGAAGYLREAARRLLRRMPRARAACARRCNVLQAQHAARADYEPHVYRG
ncbi:hypothetical protein FGB62_165g025 [Gracilaria domingensis]|nr:hypothetical protein FGB62_165g025 [Gracilaria domingensis]